MSETKYGPRRAIWILIVILAAASFIYLASLTPDTFGFYHDDSIYVATAKSLATGQGFRVISLPDAPAETKSPPFYPFLLSLIWRLYPQFPANLPAMMLLSIAATIGVLCLTFRYLTKQGYTPAFQALLVVCLTAFNWRTIVLATGIYSEMFYAALSLAALYLAEEYVKVSKNRLRGLSLGLILGLAFLTRTSGIVLLISVAVYFARRRTLSRALLPLAVASCFLVGWAAWSYVNRPINLGVNAAYYESYLRTFIDVINDLKAQNNASTAASFLSIVSKNVLMLVMVSVPLLCLGLEYDWPRFLPSTWVTIGLALFIITLALIVRGFARDRFGGLRLLHIYVALYVALHLFWPYSGYDRFLMPLLPFLLFFFIREVERLARLARTEWLSGREMTRKISAALVAVVVVMLAGFLLYNYGLGLKRALTSLKENAANRAGEDEQAIQWINQHTELSDILVCYRDPMYYLYTGRKATRSSSLREGGKIGGDEAAQDERAKAIFRIISENHARYLILTSSDLELEQQADSYQQTYRMLLDKYPSIFVPVFRSADRGSTVYRLDLDGSPDLDRSL